MLVLSEREPWARGGERLIFLHPEKQDYVIKVLKPQEEQRLRLSFRSVTQTMMPSLRKRAVNKEWKECLRLLSSEGHRGVDYFPIAMNIGNIETDIGQGVEAELIRDSDGSSPTLKSKVNGSCLTEADLHCLNDFAQKIFLLNIRASDINAKNIVFGYKPNSETYGAYLVDGFGDIHAVPVRKISIRLNRIALHQSFAKLAGKCSLIWEKGQFVRM